MKKPQWLFCSITILFLFLIAGIFIGRNFAKNYIPLNNSNFSPTESPQNSHPNSGKLDINTASLQQLQLLPGIGEVLAQRILDYRAEHGSFSSIDELKNVSGIGEKKFEEIKLYIQVGGSYENSGS